MYSIIKIESEIELPYKLIDINSLTGGEHFIFSFNEFDGNQTEYSIERGGVTGKFGIVYQSKGIDCNFKCDVTVGNVHDFYMSLDDAWDIKSGRNASAFLKCYGYDSDRTDFTINFDNKGRCFAGGHFKNAEDQYKSGVFFSFETDPIYITDILNSTENFFRELIRIQGHKNFY